jgi:hypothetical protein
MRGTVNAIGRTRAGAGRSKLRALVPLLALTLGAGAVAAAQSTTLTVDVAKDTGAVRHGATGWLYGQAEAGIPTVNTMEPLGPMVGAQKPPNGIQHPGGDALQVLPDFLASGGQQMEIYMQDIYRTFYPDDGIADYQAKVRTMMPLLLANPGHSHFVYDPFNEPDGQIYGKYGAGMTNLPRFEQDWKTIYLLIRSYDPHAVIIGPSFYNYESTLYRQFLEFAKANNVLPDQISWHELQGNFFSGWQERYDDYRGIEKSLGLAPRPIVINEYGQDHGDLGVPGQLVQFIARFETSKVDACLAYWVQSGILSGLVAADETNQVTGAWWLYDWYAGMTGDTVAVESPHPTRSGLSGIASVDRRQKQVRVLFGGAAGDLTVALHGLSAAPFLGAAAHVTLWGVDSTEFAVAKGPYPIASRNEPIADGAMTITVPQAKASSAYYAVLTPATDAPATGANTYEAEFARLSGAAVAAYGAGAESVAGYTGGGYVERLGATEAGVEFAVMAPTAGYYRAALRYAAPAQRSMELRVNGSGLGPVRLPATGGEQPWAVAARTVFLEAGINRLTIAGSSASRGVLLDAMEVTAGTGEVTKYEASAPENRRGGMAQVSGAPGGTVVEKIGGGAANYLEFRQVKAGKAGLYRVLVSFANDETYDGGKDRVYRFAEIRVNGGAPQKVYFTGTGSGFGTAEVDVYLVEGGNTIRFENDTVSLSPNVESGFAPAIARIQVAAAVVD